MADLEEQKRGQIILLLGFALAVIFIVLAIILNSAIFTGNLASRGDTSGGTDALQTRAMVEENLEDGLESANRLNYSDASTLETAIKANINETSTQIELSEVISGGLLNLTYVSSVDGTRINQSDATRNFSDANGNPDWTVVSNVSATRAFELNVTKSELEDDKGDAFRVNVTDNVDFWTADIWNDDSDSDRINISVSRSGAPDVECAPQATDSNVRIDLTDGTVDDQPCRALRVNPTSGTDYRFASNVTNPYDISFEEAFEATGTYSFVTRSGDPVDSSLNELGKGYPPPHYSDALYEVTATLKYRTSTVAYVTGVRVAPGETDG